MPLTIDAPEGKVEGLHEKLEAFAKEKGLVIWDERRWKIDWMSEHNGCCACDWTHRVCPCKEIDQDLNRFNGNCMCRVFFTPERLAEMTAQKTKIELTPLEIGQREDMNNKRKLRDEEKFKKLAKKHGKKLKKVVEF
jgi:hypothetical protein